MSEQFTITHTWLADYSAGLLSFNVLREEYRLTDQQLIRIASIYADKTCLYGRQKAWEITRDLIKQVKEDSDVT